MRIEQEYVDHITREVIDNDCYDLRSLDFTPATIFDIGANIGSFWRACRNLWPHAFIACVEPDADNFNALQRRVAGDPATALLRAALGRGDMRRREGQNPGVHGFYSQQFGYGSAMTEAGGYFSTDIKPLMLTDLFTSMPIRHPLLVKLDCEGGEGVLVDSDPDTDLLRTARCIVGEVHYFAIRSFDNDAAFSRLWNWLGQFRMTHDVHVHSWASGGNFWMYQRDPT